jgi:tartrate-resistant acid phosphatase type 5
MRIALAAVLLLLPAIAAGQRYYTYVGDVSANSVLLAWGTTEGGNNTIGRHSITLGKVLVKLGGREAITDKQNWVSFDGLEPDREYRYEVFLGRRRIGDGTVRTHPLKAARLAFFVIGDYGTGGSPQQRIAEAMWREWERRRNTDNPVRFVLTTGDNIYAYRFLWLIPYKTGDDDQHWKSKFFRPYEQLLRHIPFYPTLGNHDCGESESRGDLEVYLDNFFFPGGEPARYYRFSVGGLADFFALDSTRCALTGPSVPTYGPNSRQFAWLKDSLAASKSLWNVAYFHHPPFSAGPNHPPSLPELEHIVNLFAKNGVQVVFSGHEHNFQFSQTNTATRNMLYVVSGAGGRLRLGNVTANMDRANIAGWAPQCHFLVVEIDGRNMRITPVGYEPIRVVDSHGKPVAMPVEVAAGDRQ